MQKATPRSNNRMRVHSFTSSLLVRSNEGATVRTMMVAVATRTSAIRNDRTWPTTMEEMSYDYRQTHSWKTDEAILPEQTQQQGDNVRSGGGSVADFRLHLAVACRARQRHRVGTDV